MKKYTYHFTIFLLLVVATFFYSFRLTKTPSGMTIDESSIGYNSALISKTLKDETGNKFPVFALTINGSDWKQPVSLYSTAIFFKIFGISLFNLKFVNVIVAVASLFVIILLNYFLMGKMAGIVSGIIFMLTPTVLMHSHLAQENIMPIFFVATYLLFILLFQKKVKPLYLILAGISLGIGIYSYRGMRALTPPLIIITVLYLFLTAKESIKSPLLFIIGLSPFILVMPHLNTNYAGALFNSQSFSLRTYYDFLYPYISSFDLSALFIKGDITPWHSTGFHGVFLLSTLPLFVVGLILAAKNKLFHHYYLFLLISFFLCPLLFGQVGSVYRFSRLLIFVPFYVTFCTLSLLSLQKLKPGKILTFILGIFVILNFVDFVRYYWYEYPIIKRVSFSENNEINYIELSKKSKEKNLIPYIYVDEYIAQGDDARFYEIAYFDTKLGQWKPESKIPVGSILMTKLEHQSGFTEIGKIGNMNYLIYQ